jgi:hypothetical protein
MRDDTTPPGFLKRRRAARDVRALDKQALREEFCLDPPRGFAQRLRAYAQSVEELEMARAHAHLWTGRPRPSAAPAADSVAPAAAPAPRRTASR